MVFLQHSSLKEKRRIVDLNVSKFKAQFALILLIIMIDTNNAIDSKTKLNLRKGKPVLQVWSLTVLKYFCWLLLPWTFPVKVQIAKRDGRYEIIDVFKAHLIWIFAHN